MGQTSGKRRMADYTRLYVSCRRRWTRIDLTTDLKCQLQQNMVYYEVDFPVFIRNAMI